jgi:hypothetical protein
MSVLVVVRRSKLLMERPLSAQALIVAAVKKWLCASITLTPTFDFMVIPGFLLISFSLPD